MPTKVTAPYGSWRSPITAQQLASASIRLGQLRCSNEAVFWTERRPNEKGRNAMMVLDEQDGIKEILPGFNIRSRVHEYGGGAFTVFDDIMVFTNDDDGGIYCVFPEKQAERINPVSDNRRYTDFVIDKIRRRVICVAEEVNATASLTENYLISFDLQGMQPGQVLASGQDFYASPQVSPDGGRITWLTWNFPNMPWDGCELWLADYDDQSIIGNAKKIAGGMSESIFQPRWLNDDKLYFVSDRSGWWNLYCYDNDKVSCILPMDAEFGLPQWIFGMSTYDFASSHRIICSYQQDGSSHLALIDLQSRQIRSLPCPVSDISDVHVCGPYAIFIAASPATVPAIYRLETDTGECELLYSPQGGFLDEALLSLPQSIRYPTADGSQVHAFYYPPGNQDYDAPDGLLPPLLVKSHGGPTAATSNGLNLKIQYWTSRGFAVLDVNYRGSTGFGREYRESLRGLWGRADVEDCVFGARYLVERGLVEEKNMAISGSSAGGYTTLCALTFYNTFAAGASYYGISNLETLVQDTHKFEARYLDSLIGSYPEQQQTYHDRSPLNYSDQLSCPIVFLQGEEDRVVPPAQAESMVNILREKKLPVAYVLFSGEQHGFRKAENIQRALEVEYYFYSKVFGFECADDIEAVVIENM
ncbi:MAG: S9 family peptidase [Gammaproteobacteria bacterium]|nr:MAG: S9 family peptidase [Gammaproteobacteria bacterium]